MATPIEECARRDPKGLYARAYAGKINTSPVMSAPYEQPTRPDLRVQTTGLSPSESAGEGLNRLAALGLLLRNQGRGLP